MLTATNGLPVPVMLALVAAGRRMGWPVVTGFAAMAGVAAALYVALVLLRQAAAVGPVVQFPPAWLIAGFFLAFYSSLVALVSPEGGVIVGTLLFGVGLFFVHTTLGRRDRPRLEYFAVGILLVTMASAALAAPTRANFGIVQVAQSRYASFVQPYWTALFLIAISRWPPGRMRALAAPAIVASVAALGAQAIIGMVWVAKADNVATAGLALRSGGGDEEWLLTLYPAVATPREVSAALIADGDRTLGGPLPQLPADSLSGTPACDATAEVTPVPAGSGIRLHASVGAPSPGGLVLDRAGRTVGLARPAPVADAPNPSPMDVARAVMRTMTTPSPDRPHWIGFATSGDGGPYTLMLLDTGGAALCRVRATGP
jgi:hypothetical protein